MFQYSIKNLRFCLTYHIFGFAINLHLLQSISFREICCLLKKSLYMCNRHLQMEYTMRKVLIAMTSALFITNGEAMFAEKNKNISEIKTFQNKTVYTYPKKINNLTEVKIAGDGSCGYGALLLAAYFEFLSKGFVGKAGELQEAAACAINNDNNPARKYLLQQIITALNAGDARANFVKFLVDFTVNRADKSGNPSLDDCVNYLKRLKELPILKEEKDWLNFYETCYEQDISTELIEKTLVKSNDSSDIQNIVDVLETLDYVEYVKYRFALFDAIAYILGANFCIYNKNGEVISNRNFGFESQINIRYVEGIHYNILLSDNTLLRLNEFGVVHKSAPWGIGLSAWLTKIYGQVRLQMLPSVYSYITYHSAASIIKTNDEKYFIDLGHQYSDFFCVLEFGIGLSKIAQGHEEEGRKILRNFVSCSLYSQNRLCKELTNGDIILSFIAKDKGIDSVGLNEAIDYLHELYEQKSLNKIVEMISMRFNLTARFYDKNNNILYKSKPDNSACDLNIKFSEAEMYSNLIPINQIKFFRDRNILRKECCFFNRALFE